MADEKPIDPDEPIKIDLDPETALRGLLGVDPETEPPHDGVLTARGEPRCTYVAPASRKRCILPVGHSETHHISLTE